MGGPAARAGDEIDRSAAPRPAPTRRGALLPPLERHRLSNGLEVLIARGRGLPIVEARLVIRTGAAADAPRQAGRASMVAELLEEGTATRGAVELAEDIELLGAQLDAAASWDAISVSLQVLRPRLATALELLADVATRAAFPEAGFRRKQAERQAMLLQEREEPRVLAARAFARVVYGAEHPYGQPILGTRESIAALERDALVAFHRTFFRPNNAFLVVVGENDAAALVPLLESAFRHWQQAAVPDQAAPPAPQAGPTALHLVHRSGAEQSELRIGHAGVPRSSPDYVPILVMNTILGGAFTSRLNTRLRQEEGYTYGAGSRFDFRAGAGPFFAATAVFTDVTDDAIAIIVDEIRSLRLESVPDDELGRAREYIALGLPRRFETAADIAHRIADIELYRLGADYYDRFADDVRAVSAEDVRRVARQHLRPEHLAIVVAGDRERVEAPLRRLGLGPVQHHEVP